MKLTVTEPKLAEDDWEAQNYMEFELVSDDGDKTEFMFREGEPEDMIFGRDLNGVYSIAEALQKAFEAGKRGEELEVEYVEE